MLNKPAQYVLVFDCGAQHKKKAINVITELHQAIARLFTLIHFDK
jgi:hypothetical protein